MGLMVYKRKEKAGQTRPLQPASLRIRRYFGGTSQRPIRLTKPVSCYVWWSFISGGDHPAAFSCGKPFFPAARWASRTSAFRSLSASLFGTPSSRLWIATRPFPVDPAYSQILDALGKRLGHFLVRMAGKISLDLIVIADLNLPSFTLARLADLCCVSWTKNSHGCLIYRSQAIHRLRDVEGHV